MRIDDALGRYVEFAKAAFPKGMTLEGLRVVVDVGNGATYKSTPCVLRELGARVTVLNNAPDGTNINKDCGSTYPEVVCRLRQANSAPTLASRTTATATACSCAMRTACWWTATTCWRSPHSIG